MNQLGHVVGAGGLPYVDPPLPRAEARAVARAARGGLTVAEYRAQQNRLFQERARTRAAREASQAAERQRRLRRLALERANEARIAAQREHMFLSPTASVAYSKVLPYASRPGYSCPICQESIDDKQPCAVFRHGGRQWHPMHIFCANRWSRVNNSTCPTCRGDVGS